MPDICALLSTFISSLPTPLLEPHIYSALWHWSIKPSVKRDDARRDRQEEEEEDRRARGEPPHRGSWVTRTDLYLDDTDLALETDQLSIAQILLRFLPSANLSLLVYLCAFFTQLPLCPENGLQLEDVARIFGHRLLGGSVKLVSQRMMMWLLTRWHRISETLFGEMCGMTPPPSPSPPYVPQHKGSEVVGEESCERIEKRKGKRESGLDDALHHATSSSSSTSSLLTDSPEDNAVSSRKSSSGMEEEAESSDGSRRRKKRGLDVQASRTHAHRSSTHKERELSFNLVSFQVLNSVYTRMYYQKHAMNMGMGVVVLGRVVIVITGIRQNTRTHRPHRIHFRWVREPHISIPWFVHIHAT